MEHFVYHSGLDRRDSVIGIPGNYRYTALEDCEKQIRLCNITADPELAVTLCTVNLAECARQYICLSYPWGNDEQQETILLNQRPFKVWRNLYEMLWRLHSFGLGKNVWIDAISIDQRTSVEKSSQVDLMGRIFSQAAKVCLGVEEQVPCSPSSQPAGFRLQAALHQLAQDAHLHESACFRTAGPDESDGGIQRLLRRIMKSAWFGRTWQVQEVCLAQEVLLLCSWGTMPYALFAAAFQNFGKHRQKCCFEFAESLTEETKATWYQVTAPGLSDEK